MSIPVQAAPTLRGSLTYLTLVIDQESGRIIWVGRGKAGEALHGFWRRLKASEAKIEAVAMDMSQAYARSVAQHLPGALIVFDRFHVMELMNEKLDDLRRQLVREAESQDAKLAIKGTRWWRELKGCYERLCRWLNSTAPQLERQRQFLRLLAFETPVDPREWFGRTVLCPNG